MNSSNLCVYVYVIWLHNLYTRKKKNIFMVRRSYVLSSGHRRLGGYNKPSTFMKYFYNNILYKSDVLMCNTIPRSSTWNACTL